MTAMQEDDKDDIRRHSGVESFDVKGSCCASSSLLVNNVTSAKKKTALLITPIGQSTLRLLQGLASPKVPTDLMVAEIDKILTGHNALAMTMVAETDTTSGMKRQLLNTRPN